MKKKKLDILNSYLPNISREFETKFLELFEKEINFLDEDFLIVEKWTRKGFCLNLGCRQKYSNCDFVIKYKVYFNPSTKSFKYELLVKGGHDNFLCGESKKNSLSIISKCILKDSIKNNVLKNKEIVKLNRLTTK